MVVDLVSGRIATPNGTPSTINQSAYGPGYYYTGGFYNTWQIQNLRTALAGPITMAMGYPYLGQSGTQSAPFYYKSTPGSATIMCAGFFDSSNSLQAADNNTTLLGPRFWHPIISG